MKTFIIALPNIFTIEDPEQPSQKVCRNYFPLIRRGSTAAISSCPQDLSFQRDVAVDVPGQPGVVLNLSFLHPNVFV